MHTRAVEQKNLYQSDELYKYILETSVYPREHEQLKEIRKATATHPRFIMCMPPEQGQFLNLLLKTMNAQKTIEIGVFTGYSLLATALALPDNGKAIGIDIDRSPYDQIALPCLKMAGVEHKVEFYHSRALDVLDKLLHEGRNDEFDFAFVDAYKEDNWEYHERLLQLVRPGGIIAYDNTLVSGTVAVAEDSSLDPRSRERRRLGIDFNNFLAADSRVDISLLCLGDGFTLCRRKV